MAKVGRNQPCPCGSGKKYKRCHGDPLQPQPIPSTQFPVEEIQKAAQRHEAEELIRVQQQGEGKPIISTVWKDRRFVAIVNTLYASKDWKFFPDFLSDYLKEVLGTEWGDLELKKEWDKRHPILRWYHDYCFWQKSGGRQADGTYSATPTGVVHCYVGLAYGLYLLEHNVELQSRLVKRLKNPGNFQGAYYEVIVANCLIRAGFKLALEDETDESKKHCEFSATSMKTERRYWVEAKMKSVAGILGKTTVDGSSPTSKPNSQINAHLRDALKKPANDERLIFIDVNAPMPTHEDVANQRVPLWVDATTLQLDKKEKDLKKGQKAYVFITNLPFHRHLKIENPPKTVLAYGLGIEDFSKPGNYCLSDIWRNKQKHIDCHNIMESLGKYPQIPSTFDGKLPLAPEDAHNRIVIGGKYFFEDICEKGVIAEVTSATVSETEKRIYIGISTLDGESSIIWKELNDRELEIYKTYGDTFFGGVQPKVKQKDDPYALFEWFMDGYKDTPREKLLEMCSGHPDRPKLEKLDNTEIRLALCEAWTSQIVQSMPIRLTPIPTTCRAAMKCVTPTPPPR